MNTDLRSEPREHIRLPVHDVAGQVGHTCDVSASGMYLEADRVNEIGSLIQVTVDLEVLGRTMRLMCAGRVLRVENRAGRIGMAIKTTGSRLQTAA